MALPTVHFHSTPAASNSSLLSFWMPKLQELLFAAGWTLEYADSDAIGGSVDPGVPAWDKSPVINTDAGVAVYRMPANDHDTRWYVRVRPGWGGATNRPYIRGVTVGTAHDGSGNVSGSGTERTTGTPSSGTSTGRQVLIATSEDGFFFLLPEISAGNIVVQVERARRPDGTVEDDLVVLASHTSLSSMIANASAGAVSTDPPLAFGALTNSSSPGLPNFTLIGRDAVSLPLIGPFWPRGYPVWGPQRLAFLAPVVDVAADALVPFHIDGEARLYKGASLPIWSTWARWVVATE